ncbi:MAG TPA: endonuclease III [Candidatus Binatia bacterium]
MATKQKSSIKSAEAAARLKKILPRLEKAHPDARLDLDYKNPLELLIALILAAQARDDLVNQITADLFNIHRSAADYATTPLPILETEIGKINFYRTKARSIHNCCHELVDRFAGKVPDNLDDLLSLPGVGRKTANILLGNVYGRQTIGVDTHVSRLSQRLGFTKNSDPDKIEADLMAIVPGKQRVRFCHLMQYHGRRVCLAKKPNCPTCMIRELCPFPHKTKPALGTISSPVRRQP